MVRIQDLIKINKLFPIGRRKIVTELKCTDSYAREIFNILNNKFVIKNFLEGKEDTSEGNYSLLQDETGIILSSPIASSIEEIMEKFNIDEEYWKPIRPATINEWGSWKNYNRQIKVSLSPIGDIVDWDVFKKEFMETMKQHSLEVARIDYPQLSGGKLYEVSIFDVHLGKLSWHDETGENYDSKIAQTRFFTAIDKLTTAAKSENIDRILFPVGNDFFNTDKDYPFPQTTKGTPQENDIRWQKSYKLGRELIIKAINILKQIAPVDVVIVPSNHDKQKIFYLGDALEMFFENDENVTVNNAPTSRKYYRYGNVLLGFEHGKEVPYNRLLGLMPQEAPQDWALTKFREWHLGHKHSTKKVIAQLEEDMGGIKIKHLRSIQGADSYEHLKGYFSMGGAEAMVWDKLHGCQTVHYYNL